MNLDQMAQEAEQRISYFINRSAGQHVRAMRAHWQAQQRPVWAGLDLTPTPELADYHGIDGQIWSGLLASRPDLKGVTVVFATPSADRVKELRIELLDEEPADPTPLQLAVFGLTVAAAVATIIVICSHRAGLDVIYSILTWGLLC